MSYATLTDLANCGLPAGALASLSNTVKSQALEDYSQEADTYIGDKVQLPLVAPYDQDLVRAVCHMSAWDLLAIRGYNPSDPTDAVVATRAAMAREWLVRVANGTARLNVTASGAQESLEPDVYTNPDRGFGNVGGGGTDDPEVFVGG